MTMSAIARTGSAVAMSLGLFAGAASAQDVTYTKDVAPILQRSSQTCHPTGSIAPLSTDLSIDRKSSSLPIVEPMMRR